MSTILRHNVPWCNIIIVGVLHAMIVKEWRKKIRRTNYEKKNMGRKRKYKNVDVELCAGMLMIFATMELEAALP